MAKIERTNKQYFNSHSQCILIVFHCDCNEIDDFKVGKLTAKLVWILIGFKALLQSVLNTLHLKCFCCFHCCCCYVFGWTAHTAYVQRGSAVWWQIKHSHARSTHWPETF